MAKPSSLQNTGMNSYRTEPWKPSPMTGPTQPPRKRKADDKDQDDSSKDRVQRSDMKRRVVNCPRKPHGSTLSASSCQVITKTEDPALASRHDSEVKDNEAGRIEEHDVMVWECEDGQARVRHWDEPHAPEQAPAPEEMACIDFYGLLGGYPPSNSTKASLVDQLAHQIELMALGEKCQGDMELDDSPVEVQLATGINHVSLAGGAEEVCYTGQSPPP